MCTSKYRRDHFGDLGIDRRLLLKLILKKMNEKMHTEFIWLRE
jgi:hypothetical protein